MPVVLVENETCPQIFFFFVNEGILKKLKKMKRSIESNIPIAQHIEVHRETLSRQKQDIPRLTAQYMRLRNAYDACSGRCMLRRKSDLAIELDKLTQKIRRLENDEHIEEFERQIVPYMQAYVRHSGAPKTKVSRFLIPGEPSVLADACEATQTQSDVVSEYLSAVQGETPRPVLERPDMCPRCIDTAMVLVPSRAILVCPICARSATFLDATSSSISYDESIEMVTFSYKRCNHFNDWMSNVQGLEAYEVPQEVVENVMMELYKQRITDLNEITTKRVRTILKSLKMRKCYDHVAQITSRITGRPPLRLPAEVAELCRLMFTAVQIPFAKYCPADRKNFLSYSFILSKLLYILGYDDLCETLTMLKGIDKLKKMDEVWRHIARDLDWEWFPSV